MSWIQGRCDGVWIGCDVEVACAAIGTDAWVVFGNGMVASPIAQEALGPPLLEPQMIVAGNGVVGLTLEASSSVVTVHDKTFTSNVYNGQYTPPVFRLRRGDELQLRLVNRIGPADVQLTRRKPPTCTITA